MYHKIYKFSKFVELLLSVSYLRVSRSSVCDEWFGVYVHTLSYSVEFLCARVLEKSVLFFACGVHRFKAGSRAYSRSLFRIQQFLKSHGFRSFSIRMPKPMNLTLKFCHLFHDLGPFIGPKSPGQRKMRTYRNLE